MVLLFIQNIFPFLIGLNTRIIHHNQLLFTKFGKNLHHIESMTSKVQPAKNYWTDDVNGWLRKPGDKVVLYLVSRKTKSETPLGRRKYFEWIITQLLNLALVGYEEFCGSRGDVIHLDLRPLWITPSLTCRILHILRKPNSIIAYYSFKIFPSS